MAKPKQGEVLGVKTQTDRATGITSWVLDGVTYFWSALGWCWYVKGEQGERRIVFSRNIHGAVGYTCGWHDASNLAARANHSAD